MVGAHHICLIVVFYHPSEEQIAFYHSLADQGLNVIIVDNSSKSLEGLSAIYIPLGHNRGIAAAQNVGIAEAKKRGFEYIVFFDQDSQFEVSYISSILDEYNTIKQQDPSIATLGPLLIDSRTNQEYLSNIKPSVPYSIDTHIISSGSIVETKTFEKVGLYEERLFIDLVDSEWCWRARKYGLNTYMTRRVKLYHSMGQTYHHLGRFAYGLSAPWRYYYQYRNAIWMLRRDYVPFRWKYRTIIRRLFDLVFYPVMAPEKKMDILRNMLKGIRDGLKML